MTFIVDANVALKWFAPEADRDKAAILLEDTSLLEAPDLIIPEVANTAWKKWRRGEFSADQAEIVVPALLRLISIIHPSEALYERAVRLSLNLDHPAYDCFYLACADLRDGVMVTADKALFDRVQTSGAGPRIRFLGDWSPDTP